jgi:hypothetical protein
MTVHPGSGQNRVVGGHPAPWPLLAGLHVFADGVQRNPLKGRRPVGGRPALLGRPSGGSRGSVQHV